MSPAKDKYDNEKEEPMPEENLTDDSLEMEKHLPNEVAPRNTGLMQNDQDGPIDPQSRGASGMAQREKEVNPQFSKQKIASGRPKPAEIAPSFANPKSQNQLSIINSNRQAK